LPDASRQNARTCSEQRGFGKISYFSKICPNYSHRFKGFYLRNKYAIFVFERVRFIVQHHDKNMVIASVIIGYYQHLANLELILHALAAQSETHFECIVAEDDDCAETKVFLATIQAVLPFRVLHVSQPDLGFRKCKALNQAVRVANSAYLIFIDGDCLPHTHFVRAHTHHAEIGIANYGRRVMLSAKHTQHIYRMLANLVPPSRILSELTLVSIWRMGGTRLKYGLYLPWMPIAKPSQKSGIWGCNWSIHKSDLAKVNGFDEDFTKPGYGEDTDIEYRLFQTGLQLRYLKYAAVQYHLDHSLNYLDTQENELLMKRKRESGEVWAKNGLVKGEVS
jgi:glycosyltransferase involved in cell wall biosynthesis